MMINMPNELQMVSNNLTSNVIIKLCEAIDEHGLQSDISIHKQLTITTEEFGEVAKAILEEDNVEEEIYQTIAMLVKLLWLYKNGNR